MKSTDAQVNALLDAYVKATGINVPMLPTFERWLFDALQEGMTPEDVALVARERQGMIKAGRRYKESLLMRNFFRDDEARASVIEEAAAIRARARAPKFDSGKAQVLKATGRATQPELKGVRTIGEVLDAMRREAK